MNSSPFPLLNAQYKMMQYAVHGEGLHVLYKAGVGSGKTFVGGAISAMESQRSTGLILGQDLTTIAGATLTGAKAYWDSIGMKSKWSLGGSEPYLELDGRRHFVRSAKGSDITGIEVGWLWVDEAAFCNYEQVKRAYARVRLPGGSLNKYLTTTPKGFDEIYHEFEENKTPKHYTISTSSFANHHLPKSYLDFLDTLDGEWRAQEVDGQYVRFGGSVFNPSFSDFDRKLLKGSKVSISIDPGLRFPFVSFFFNNGNADCPKEVMFDYIAKKRIDRDTLYDEILNKINKWGISNIDRITIDPASSAENSSGTMSDLAFFVQKFPDSKVSYIKNPKFRSISAGIVLTNRFFKTKCLTIASDIDEVNKKESYYCQAIQAVSGIGYQKNKNVYGKGESVKEWDHCCDTVRYFVAFSYPEFMFDEERWRKVLRSSK